MTNNDILKRLRYSFAFDDSKMIAIFELGAMTVTREQVSDWLKKEEDPAYKKCHDTQLASFLNGLITNNRGKKDGPPPKTELRLNNNIILRKLKIALDLHAEDIIEIVALTDTQLSKHELSSFLRRQDHRQYRECKEQFLRKFLKGIQLKYRDNLQDDC